ncbi:MAG: sulfatase [Phycisphaerales bacterium]|nr:MAG: sulfatase [Phycisphaerales bacterium]
MRTAAAIETRSPKMKARTICRMFLSHGSMLSSWLSVLAVILSLFHGRACAAQRPNVLLVISDDLNNSIGCYGHPQVETPNIDRLASRGVRFERAYCQFPLCGPSRNSMLCGLHPNSTGILRNSQIFRQTIPSHHSLPQAFRLQGYFAARIGKLYHYNVPKSIGTNGHDDPASWELELNPAGCDRLEEEPHIFSLIPGRFGGTLSWYASPKSDQYHTDGLLAADAEWVLERCARKKDRPFFLAVGFYRPHTPYVSPKLYFDRYPEREMPVVRGVKEDQADLPVPALASYKKEQDKLTDDLRRQCVQAYFASITFMDAQLGRVLDALERLGLADNTIIVFTSDHGYHLGEHGLWQKMSVFEESARVPLIIAAPGTSVKGQVANDPVGLIDLYPTLTELCGVKARKNLQGQSLVPMLKDPSATGRGWAITQVTRNRGKKQGGQFFGYSLRTPRWRYTEWADGKQGRELYDHDADPRELNNLAGDTAHAGMIARLSKQLRKAIRQTFPASGETPELRPALWAPNLTNP